MRLLQTHSHTSERLGCEAGKNTKKSNWRKTQENAGALTRQTTVRTLPQTASVAGGARRRKAIEGKRGRYYKGNQRQDPPADRQRGRGRKRKSENQHGMERWHNAQSREEGKYLAENA